jgi:hypothetical protein
MRQADIRMTKAPSRVDLTMWMQFCLRGSNWISWTWRSLAWRAYP